MKIYSFNGKCNVSGSRIRERREEMGISQTQLAARMEISGIIINQKAISRIETGDRVIADYELATFAKVLSLPMEAFFDKKFFFNA